MHSHLLPGIDDGAATVEESVALIRGLMDLGFTRLYATPHVYREYYPNTPQTIGAALEVLREALDREGLDIAVEAAAEYYVDEFFEELVPGGDLLTLPGRRVLIEMSFFAPYPRLHQVLFDLCTRGYRPVLAHPERYPYFARRLDALEDLRDRGCSFQVNLPAFAGAYGGAVRDTAFRLLEKGWVDFVGTDLHNRRQVEVLKKMAHNPKLQRALNRGEFSNNLLV
jgi:tyrosine-protein phosphatase YwqE